MWIALRFFSGYVAGVVGVAFASSARAPWIAEDRNEWPIRVTMWLVMSLGGPASWVLTAAMYLAHHKEMR